MPMTRPSLKAFNSKIPGIKHKLLNTLKAELFGPQRALTRSKIHELALSQQKLTSHGKPSFYYKGQTYSLSATNMHGESIYPITQLDPSLVSEMDKIDTQRKQFDKDYERPLTLFLINLLNTSFSAQDILALLPSELHKPVQAHLAKYTQNDLKRPQLTEAQIKRFMDQHQSEYSKVKEVLMTNVLLK